MWFVSFESSMKATQIFCLNIYIHGVQIPVRARDFSLVQNVQTGTEARPASSSMDTEVSFPVVTRPEREFNRLPQSNTAVRSALP